MFGIDLTQLLVTGGYIGLFLIIFAESGVFAGFFFPGDSLLFTAGILAATGFFNIWILLILCAPAAILGDSFGYAFGRFIGPRIFNKEDSFFFRRRHLEETAAFYEKHGKKTIILARFTPIVRTFAPIFAGVGGMEYKTFLRYNIFGGFLWTWGLLLLSYFVGRSIPNVERYFSWIIGVIILTSFIPIIQHFATRFFSKKP